MASDLFVGLKIGVTLAGSVLGVLGGVRQGVDAIGGATDKLKAKQQRLGLILREAFAHPLRDIARLSERYRQLGKDIEFAQKMQTKLTGYARLGDSLQQSRRNIRGEVYETAALGGSFFAPLIKSIKEASGFEDKVKDIAITGEMSEAQEMALGKSLRRVALQTNQHHTDLTQGVGALVAEGMDPVKAAGQAALLGKTATASRAEMSDLAKMNVTFDKVLGVKDMELAFNQAAKAGKQGSFELKDMAKWLPALGGQLKSLGVVGNEAVVNLASRLQIARRTAGNNDEAANNLKNFLTKLSSPDTEKDFKKLGINLQEQLRASARKGLDPVEAGITLIMEQIGKSAPGAADELKKLSLELSKIKDPVMRAAELERRRTFIEALGQKSGLGKMFQDMQAMSYLLAEVQNRGDLKSIMDSTRTGKAEDGRNTLDVDFDRRLKGANEAFKGIMIRASELGITLGSVLLPPLLSILDDVRPVINAFAQWAEENPRLVKGIVGLVGGLLLVKMGVLAFRYAIIGVTSLVSGLSKGFWMLKNSGAILRVLLNAGYFSSFISGAQWVTRFLGSFLTMTLRVAKMLGGQLFFALRLVGGAVMWLGRLFLINPVGLLVTGIAIAAYLVYQNWDKIKLSFMQAYQYLKGLTHQFYDAGKHIIEGLVEGIKAKLGAAKDTIINFGQNIKGWFSATLGIQSPSRVFMGFGDNIGQGAKIGIDNSRADVKRAVARLSKDAMPLDLTMPTPAQRGSQRHSGTQAGSVHLTYSPNITVPQGSTGDWLIQTLRDHSRELEILLRKVVAEQTRRAY